MTAYKQLIETAHIDLGIPKDYAQKTRLTLQTESTDLCDVGSDIYDRPQKIAQNALKPWSQMKAQAEQDGITINIVSVFRSVNRQIEIIQSKLDKGEQIEDILKISAAPGYSEHHTGRALDLTTNDCRVLELEFENTAAFSWLEKKAALFSFHLSYPKNNPHGITYEPWHWAYREN